MNRTVVASMAIAAAAAAACFYLYLAATRYAVVNAGNGRVYRVDRRTGDSVLLQGTREIKVESPDGALNSAPENVAIRLAKEARTLDSGSMLSNDFQIRDWLGSQEGELRLLGWKAKRIDAQVFLVTYEIEAERTSRSWAFEVQTEARLVRNVTGDRKLEVKYGFARP